MSRIDADTRRAWQLLVRFFFTQRERLPSAEEADLSAVQCHVLHLIEPGRPVPMSRLAEVLSCDASNVTGLVDRMEARGLLARRPSPGDRRVKVLVLTAQGARLRDQMLRHMTGQPLPLSSLTPDERRALVGLLERLVGEES